jgi:hypothetical protein
MRWTPTHEGGEPTGRNPTDRGLAPLLTLTMILIDIHHRLVGAEF